MNECIFFNIIDNLYVSSQTIKALVPTHFGCGGGSAGKNVLKPGRVRIIVLSGGQDPSLGDYHPAKNNITSGHKQTKHHLLVKNRPSLASEWETLWGSLWCMTRIPKMKISWRRGEQYTSPVTYINWLNNALRGYHLGGDLVMPTRVLACQQSDYAGVKTRQSILGLPIRKLAARHQGKGVERFKQMGSINYTAIHLYKKR